MCWFSPYLYFSKILLEHNAAKRLTEKIAHFIEKISDSQKWLLKIKFKVLIV